MSKFNADEYMNLIPYIGFSSREIEDVIREYKLKFYKTRNERVEWKIKFPSFVLSFYGHIFRKNKIPTQEEFFEYYVEKNKDWFDKQDFDESIMVGLKARLFRTYPSLMRDIHFSKYVYEKLETEAVVYNHDLDVKCGIDLLITNNGEHYGLCLYTDTEIARSVRAKKISKSQKLQNVNYLEVPVDFSGSNSVGDFFLYGNRELDLIKTILTNTTNAVEVEK